MCVAGYWLNFSFNVNVKHRSEQLRRMDAIQMHIGLYRENAIAIESEARDPNGGNVYYVTMQITFHFLEFERKERNLHCDVVHITTILDVAIFIYLQKKLHCCHYCGPQI